MSHIKKLFSSLRTTIRRNKNSQFPMFLITAIIGYSLLFTSNAWVPDMNASDAYTAIEATTTLDKRDFTLKNWVYAPSQKMMEIEIDVTNRNYDNINKYLFSCRDQNYELVKVSPVIEENNLLVIHILNVPEDFKELSFRLKVDYGDTTDDVAKMIRFYTNRDMVSTVDTIETKTIPEYYAARLERNIGSYNTAIQTLQEEIDALYLKISLGKEEISTLKNNIPLQSVDEASRSNKRISEINDNILDFELEITTKRDSILEVQEKIKEAQAKLADWNQKK